LRLLVETCTTTIPPSFHHIIRTAKSAREVLERLGECFEEDAIESICACTIRAMLRRPELWQSQEKPLRLVGGAA
jgi:hypothetical protein